MSDTFTIDGHEYGVDGAWLIAERYPDGVELRLYCVSGGEPVTAQFVRRGPRGGLYTIGLNRLTHESISTLGLRLSDAREHLRRVSEWAQEHFKR